MKCLAARLTALALALAACTPSTAPSSRRTPPASPVTSAGAVRCDPGKSALAVTPPDRGYVRLVPTSACELWLVGGSTGPGIAQGRLVNRTLTVDHHVDIPQEVASLVLAVRVGATLWVAGATTTGGPYLGHVAVGAGRLVSVSVPPGSARIDDLVPDPTDDSVRALLKMRTQAAAVWTPNVGLAQLGVGTWNFLGSNARNMVTVAGVSAGRLWVAESIDGSRHWSYYKRRTRLVALTGAGYLAGSPYVTGLLGNVQIEDTRGVLQFLDAERRATDAAPLPYFRLEGVASLTGGRIGILADWRSGSLLSVGLLGGTSKALKLPGHPPSYSQIAALDDEVWLLGPTIVHLRL